MKLSTIHNLIKNHIYFANVPEKEILGIYESCYHTLLSNRTTIVDLLSTGFTELINNWEFDEKLGLQAIDAKLQEKYPLLTADDRLLLYRMAQDRVSQFYVTGYELNTLRGNIYKGIELLNSLSLRTKVFETHTEQLTYISSLGYKLTLPEITKTNLKYISRLSVRVFSMIDESKKAFYKSTLGLNIALADMQKRVLNYVSNLGYRLKLLDEKTTIYKNQLSLSCRVITDFDEQVGLTYKSELSLNLSLE